MPKLPHLSGGEIQRALERLGFRKVRQSGSHVVMKRDTRGWQPAPPQAKPAVDGKFFT